MSKHNTKLNCLESRLSGCVLLHAICKRCFFFYSRQDLLLVEVISRSWEVSCLGFPLVLYSLSPLGNASWTHLLFPWAFHKEQ